MWIREAGIRLREESRGNITKLESRSREQVSGNWDLRFTCPQNALCPLFATFACRNGGKRTKLSHPVHREALNRISAWPAGPAPLPGRRHGASRQTTAARYAMRCAPGMFHHEGSRLHVDMRWRRAAKNSTIWHCPARGLRRLTLSPDSHESAGGSRRDTAFNQNRCVKL